MKPFRHVCEQTPMWLAAGGCHASLRAEKRVMAVQVTITTDSRVMRLNMHDGT